MDDDWKLRADDWKRMYQVKQKDWLDACDEIDALEAEIAELKAQLASPMLRCHKAGHRDEIDALKAELKACEIALDGEIKAGDEARSEVAKLRGALKKALDGWGSCVEMGQEEEFQACCKVAGVEY